MKSLGSDALMAPGPYVMVVLIHMGMFMQLICLVSYFYGMKMVDIAQMATNTLEMLPHMGVGEERSIINDSKKEEEKCN